MDRDPADGMGLLHQLLEEASRASDPNAFLWDGLRRILQALGAPLGAIQVDGRTIAIGIAPEAMGPILRWAEGSGRGPGSTGSIEDGEALPSAPLREALRGAGIRAALLTPIRSHARPIGWLLVGDPSPRRWTPEEVARLEAAALAIGHGVERLRAFQQLRLLYQLADALVAPHDLPAALQPVFKAFRAALDAAAVCLYRTTRPDPSTMHRVVCAGSPGPLGERIRYEELPRSAARPGTLLWTLDVPGMASPLAPPGRGVALPLEREGVRLGLFAVIWAHPVPLDEDLSDLLIRAARLLTAAVWNDRLREEQQAYARDLELLNETLQRALIAREQMIQNVSHELRTPLAILQGYLELMHEEALGPLTPAQREAVAVMRDRLAGLIRYVELLLILQEIRAEARSLNILDLRELVQTACQAYAARIDPRRHTLAVDLPDRPVWVLGEGQPLLLALTELLENAVKFSPGGGTIRVSLTVQGREACLQVADEGIGIPAEALPRVFDPFYQVDGGTTRRFGGMGIGLTAVKQVVEAHHGSIWIESEVGRGTRVTLRLPIMLPAGPVGN